MQPFGLTTLFAVLVSMGFCRGEALRTAREVHLLSVEQAAKGLPVKIRGVVTFHNWDKQCFVQDESDGVYIQRPRGAADLWPGQLVELEGVTSPGVFAPQVEERSVRVIGEDKLPRPMEISMERMVSGTEDCKFGEVRGVVRSAKMFRSGDLQLMMAVGDGRLRAYVYGFEGTNVAGLVDSTVRLRGVAGGHFNQKRQMIAPLFFVAGATNMMVEEAAAESPFDGPVRSVQNLFQFTPNSPYARRVKVRGVVTHHRAGQFLYIRDGIQGLAVQSEESAPARPGDVVEVLGFPTMGPHVPFLQDAMYRRIEHGAAPIAIETTAEEILKGGFDSDLVKVRAQLLDADKRVLALQAGDVLFNAYIEGAGMDRLPAWLEKGSELVVTGICRVQEVGETTLGRFAPRSFQLLVRSAADISLVRSPSRWTVERLLWILSGMAVLALAALLWVRLLRRKVSEQTEIIRRTIEREAILEERTRIARELHDTLAQGFAGVAYQLEAVAASVAKAPEEAKEHLEVALDMVWQSSREARRAVKDLRAPLLETGDLVEALRESVQRLAAGAPIKASVEVVGTRRRLAGLVENELLRLGQEAVTNAIKHAQANRVAVILRFGTEEIELVVRDDGRGFQPAMDEMDGHFGLVGMRERARKIGAEFVLRRAPNRGVEIIVSVPNREQHKGFQRHEETESNTHFAGR